MEINFLEKLMQQIIVEGTKTPKAQVERYISPILAIFIEDILKELTNGKIFKLICPEFPLRLKTVKKDCQERSKRNLSVNIDFLLLNETDKKLTFFELKTDSTSYNQSQSELYSTLKEISKSNNEFSKILYKDLNDIYEATKLKDKYQFVIDRWKNVVEDGNDINGIEIIYLIPESTKQKTDKDSKTYFFKNIPKVLSNVSAQNKNFTEEYAIIVHYLHKLDDN